MSIKSSLSENKIYYPRPGSKKNNNAKHLNRIECSGVPRRVNYHVYYFP